MRRLLLLCVPLSLCFVAGSRLPADDAKTKDAAAKASPKEEKDDRKWKSLFDGKSLAGWKVPNFGTQGDVEIEDGQIHLGFGDGCTGVTYTKDFPKWNYEVSCDAMRVDGNDFFCGMTFRVGDDPCSFIPGGWGGTVVGLSTIDGYDAANNSTSSFFRFKDKTWYTFRVRVTKERIQCFIDKEKVVDQELEGHKISIRSEVELSRPFGIASWKTTAALKNIKVRELEAGEK